MQITLGNKKLYLSKLRFPRFSEDSIEVIARRVTIILLLIISWSLGQLVWSWVTPSASIEQPSTNTATTAVIRSNLPDSSYQLDALKKQNLFGEYDQTAVAVVDVSANAPETTLKLLLVGVVASDVPTKSVAVIANNGTQELYGVGDTITGTRVILRQVFSDRVILNNSGRNETLMLDGMDFDESIPQPVNTATKPEPSKDEPEKVQIANLDSIRAEITQSPQAILKYLTMAQERDTNGLKGFRIGPGKDDTLFNDAGLQAGDIATVMNDVDLTDPAGINRVWQSLVDASEISLTVLRNGQPHKIYIALE